MARFLITGGAGFIGSHLAEAYVQRGDEVVILDNASTGDFANLAAIQDHPHVTCLHGSVCDPMLVDEACSGVDHIIHLAAAVGVMRIMDKRVQSIQTNLTGTETVLQQP